MIGSYPRKLYSQSQSTTETIQLTLHAANQITLWDCLQPITLPHGTACSQSQSTSNDLDNCLEVALSTVCTSLCQQETLTTRCVSQKPQGKWLVAHHVILRAHLCEVCLARPIISFPWSYFSSVSLPCYSAQSCLLYRSCYFFSMISDGPGVHCFQHKTRCLESQSLYLLFVTFVHLQNCSRNWIL